MLTTWLHKWVISEQWRLSAVSRLPWRLRVLCCTNPHKTTLLFVIPFNFLFSPKEAICIKYKTLQKYSTLTLFFNYGPSWPSVPSADFHFISRDSHFRLLCALYRTSVNLKWDDVVGNEWQGDKNDTCWRLHTHYTICAILSHYPKAQRHMGKGRRMKSCKF